MDINIWSAVITTVIAALGTYVGFIHGLRIRVAVLESNLDQLEGEVQRIEKRLDKKSEQFDKILESMSDIREKLTRIATVLDIEEAKR